MEISRGISHEVIWYTAHKKLVHVQIYESKCQPAVKTFACYPLAAWICHLARAETENQN